MSIKHVLLAAAAVSMTATPVLAAPANPAAKLSVASQARAGSSTARDSRAVGGGVIAALIAAGVAAILIVDVVRDEDDDDSDSN